MFHWNKLEDQSYSCGLFTDIISNFIYDIRVCKVVQLCKKFYVTSEKIVLLLDEIYKLRDRILYPGSYYEDTK